MTLSPAEPSKPPGAAIPDLSGDAAGDALTDDARSEDAAGDALALQNQVCFALAVASRTVIGLYKPILEPLHLTHPQYLVMLALWEQSPRSVKNLAAALSLEPATLSPLLKRLESLGYLTRDRAADDERMLRVGLTSAGRALRSVALTIPPRVVEALDLDLETLSELRDRLHEITRAAVTAPTRAKVES